jgi:MHS family proline/betaine transporter-like MFS transporter
MGKNEGMGWRWRIPFLIAASIGLVGFYLRNKLEETPHLILNR